ncbi:MAG TPA: hypothetical protein VMA72_12675 [Streptosporangiaceae bacterium]|nr:hypothetical protein [Streptosporangiaceae bacterium]
MAAVGPETWYRRLVRWYPADHRAVHQEEMLGVLMAGAKPGRSRPSLAESADLLLGAARIRLRPGRALSDGPGWRDALAVYGVAAPWLVLVSTLLGWLGAQLGFGHTGVGVDGLAMMVTGIGSGHLAFLTAIWVAVGGQALVAVLALLGLRWWAAAVAAISALYLGITAIHLLYTPLSVGIAISVLYIPFALVAPISETVALLVSPGPRRGRQLMGRRDWALLAVGSMAAAALTRDFSFVPFRFGGEGLRLTFLLLAGLAVVVLLVVLWLSSAHGKRLALLFGVLAYGLLVMDGLIDEGGPWGADTINGAAGQVLVLVLLAAVTYRTWRRSRSAAGGSGESPT